MSARATISSADIVAAAKADDGTGFCLECGEQADEVEPDARGYQCDYCDAHAVFGAEELLIHGYGS